MSGANAFVKGSKMVTEFNNGRNHHCLNPVHFGSNFVTPQTLCQKLHDYTSCLPISFGLSRIATQAIRKLSQAPDHRCSSPSSINGCQVVNQPIEEVYKYKQELEKTKLRNWKYVVSKMLDLTYLEESKEDPLVDNELFRLASIKATASTIAQLLSMHTSEENIFATLIGYWISKLYPISVYSANPKDLPEPLPALYSRFLDLYGNKYRAKSPEFGFNPYMFENPEAMLALFPFLKERIPSPQIKVLGRKEDDNYQRITILLWNYFREEYLRECFKHRRQPI